MKTPIIKSSSEIGMIDKDGFRRGVGIIVCNENNQVLWAKRRKKEIWQFPQGGIKEDETPQEALYRELEEEIGLTALDVKLLGNTYSWLTYRWPDPQRLIHSNPNCIGQKQMWFLLRLVSADTAIYLYNTDPPEFDQWRWVEYWYPLDHIVLFKKEAYQQALHELSLYR